MISYVVSALSLGAITYILVMGLNVRWGWAGELDLAYYAFVALGAYFGAVLQLPPSTEGSGSGWILGLQLPFVVGLLGGTLISAAASAIVGAIALRKLRGEYLAITTVAFTFIAAAVLSQDARLFDGFNGVYGLTEPFRGTFNVSPQTYAALLLLLLAALALIVYLILEALYRSPFGRTLRMIREDQVSASAFGRNVYAEKLKAYVIGGACAGFGGVLLAQWLSAFNHLPAVHRHLHRRPGEPAWHPHRHSRRPRDHPAGEPVPAHHPRPQRPLARHALRSQRHPHHPRPPLPPPGPPARA